jgi:diaminohydroxyphosphoribosylaminopyrimidine deaminase/5-amino-6-(5-phosphoribosylamino)uracil reductase
MQVALSLARRQLGQTHPNPNVGAILVKDGQIIAQGITATGGRPHAETIAINNAGDRASGATLYVTLEPCSHHGKTPPCVDAIISAGIKTVVISCRDKNPEVSGNGITALKNAGIEVIENICTKEGLEVNKGFFSVIEKKRPYIALKIATSIDGKITSPTQRWLTGEPARNYGHLLRSQYDAILTGSGTVLADNPLLTCRLAGLEHRSPVRIILDRNNRIPKNAQMLNDGHESWVMSHESLEETITEITKRGITSLLVEAGAKLTTAFLQSGLVDKVYWFRAPITIGEKGLCVASALERLANFKQIEHIKLGKDDLDIYECLQG